MTGTRATAGAAWLVSGRLVARLIDLATLLLLARLLTPGDFGVVAVAMTLIYIVEAVLELPVGCVLVQMQKPERVHYDTAFTLGLLRGLVLAGVLCAVAWPYAVIFDDPRLATIVIALGLAPIMRGCVSPRLAHYTRELRFERDCAMIVIGKIASLAAAISTALLHGSYWALVAATVAGPSTMVLVSYLLAPYRPRLTLAELPVFKGFLGWLSAAQVVSAINWQCDRLFLGKLVGRSELGQFSVAGDLAGLPIQTLAIPIAAPLFPALSQVRAEPDRLQATFVAGIGAIVAICWPVMIGLAMLAEPLVLLVLGQQWSASIVLVQLLAVAGAFAVIAFPSGALALAMGRTKLVFQRGLIEFAVKLPAMFVAGLAFGLIGIAYARILADVTMMVINLLIARHLIGVDMRSQLGVCLRPLAGVTVMAFVLSALRPERADLSQPIEVVLWLLAVTIAGGIAYVATLMGLWRLAGRPIGIESELMRLGASLRYRAFRTRSDATA